MPRFGDCQICLDRPNSKIKGKKEWENPIDEKEGGTMTYKGVLAIVVTIIIMMMVLGYRGALSGSQDSSPTRTQAGIPAEKVADIVHAVIQADRAFYTVHVVERLQTMGVVVASENWRTQKTLPLPVQFLEESARLAANTQAKISYKLISLWPINKRNAPKTEFDQAGLGRSFSIPINHILEW